MTSTARPCVRADRDLLKLTQQDFTRLPQHLQLELAIATVLCCIGDQHAREDYACLAREMRCRRLPLLPTLPAAPRRGVPDRRHHEAVDVQPWRAVRTLRINSHMPWQALISGRAPG